VTAPAAFFAVANADALAHAALPSVEELVGNGWEVTSSDSFDKGGDDLDFDKAVNEHAECAGLSGLTKIGGAFGDNTNEAPAGRAQVEFDNQLQGDIPSSIEVQIEIQDTVAEVQDGWGIAKQLMEGDAFKSCMLAIIPQAIAAQTEGMQVEISSRENSATPPENGFSIAFDMQITVAGTEIAMAMEMYMWPYANASTTVTVLGSPDSFDAISVASALHTVERKLADAAA